MKYKPDNDMIKSAIAFIENRLTENFTINEIADHFFQKLHCHRLFHSILGKPVMEYIKKRRLLLAFHELCGTKTHVFAIALKYEYKSYEGFTRALKRYYGIAPSCYRKLNAKKMNHKATSIKNGLAGRILLSVSFFLDLYGWIEHHTVWHDAHMYMVFT